MSLARIEEHPGGERSLFWWCPGCGHHHAADLKPLGRWTLSGDPAIAPTLAPSFRSFVSDPEEGEQTLCHCFIRDGRIEFLADCAHELAGHTVSMVGLESVK